MSKSVDKNMIHRVIDALPPNELEVIYKLFHSFIIDYQDSHLTPDEISAHNQALLADEWYE